MAAPLTIAAVDAMDSVAFVAALGHVFEHSAWVAEEAWPARPFGSVDRLHKAMMDAVLNAPEGRQVALLRAHPELAGREAQEGTLTKDSTSEQSRLGFSALSKEELAQMVDLNRRYRERFGFPCIIALHRHATRQTVLAEHAARLSNDRGQEIRTCVDQVGFITRGQLDKLFAPG